MSKSLDPQRKTALDSRGQHCVFVSVVICQQKSHI